MLIFLLLKKVESKEWVFNFKNHSQRFLPTSSGLYLLEAYGASGIYNLNAPEFRSRGAYASAIIKITTPFPIYIFTGESSHEQDLTKYTYHKVFNGGGSGGTGVFMPTGTNGGGATDFRTIDGDWDDFTSLLSRFIVAAGAGGQSNYFTNSESNYYGGNCQYGTREDFYGCGGTLSAPNGTWGSTSPDPNNWYSNGYGANQTHGGADYDLVIRSGFGYGADAQNHTGNWYGTMPASGGGGGYYGGGSGRWAGYVAGGGGGGSSFAYGYPGCIPHENAIFPQYLHLYNQTLKAGYEQIPNPEGEGFAQGRNGNGIAKITLLRIISNPNQVEDHLPQMFMYTICIVYHKHCKQ